MVKGIYKFFILCLASLAWESAFSQYYYYNNKYYDNDIVFELGGSIGGMNCITDLGGEKSKKHYINEFSIKNNQLSGSIFLGALYQQKVGLRLEATWGNIQAYDSILKSAPPSRFKRNLSFRSAIQEISLLAEVHPFMFKYYEDEPPRFSPYLIGGVGWFSFNPQANLNGIWVDLQPLSTEGQGFPEYKDRLPYKLHQVNIPLGAGIKYEVSQLLNLRFEFMHRILFTDYLDDASINYINPVLFSKYFSPKKAADAKALFFRGNYNIKFPGGTRGDPKHNDAYFTFNFKVGLSLGRRSIN